jgi:integrase
MSLGRVLNQEPEVLVFPGNDGGVLRANGWRARHWQPAVRARVSTLSVPNLRHSAVSLWIAAGATPKQIATWAGHTSVSVVLDRYGHLFPGHEEAVLARLEDLGNVAPAPRDVVFDLGARPDPAGLSRGEQK